jgi:hypothetical protein
MDILGHINNTVPAAWFELARNPLFKIFDPALKLTGGRFPLIMAHTDYDFVDQLYSQWGLIPKSPPFGGGALGRLELVNTHEKW